jgi:very-short-patch-repair endonuclease
VNRTAPNLLPDEPWPLSARKLLSVREQEFYQRLIGLYPDHKILVQVALSQLIKVDQNHPERHSIRARYKQLVADFVLCRADLSVITVIELDDRTHERPNRKAADARKNKALADAGIRLVRIPAGRLPSEDALRALIDADGKSQSRFQEVPELSLAEDTYSPETEYESEEESSAVSRELRRVVMRVIVGAVFLAGGWFLYSYVLPSVIQQAFQPLAAKPARSVQAPSQSVITPRRALSTPAAFEIRGNASADMKVSQMQETSALQKRKQAAWAAFYSAPASCEHPVDWNAQVECGNRYMRAKKVFELKWAAEHPSQGSGAEVVLGNSSLKK